MLHAASQELESGALSACHQLSAAAAAGCGGEEGGADDGGAGGALPAPLPDHSPRSGAARLSCHVLATASQVLALGEVRRVDHSLKVRTLWGMEGGVCRVVGWLLLAGDDGDDDV